MRFGTPQTAGRPCNGCTERRVGCHGHCDKEAAWLAEQTPKQEARYAVMNREREIDSFRQTQIRKAKKRRRTK